MTCFSRRACLGAGVIVLLAAAGISTACGKADSGTSGEDGKRAVPPRSKDVKDAAKLVDVGPRMKDERVLAVHALAERWVLGRADDGPQDVLLHVQAELVELAGAQALGPGLVGKGVEGASIDGADVAGRHGIQRDLQPEAVLEGIWYQERTPVTQREGEGPIANRNEQDGG
jgi:hypothetical protein